MTVALAIIAGHIVSIRTATIAVTQSGLRHTRFMASVRTPSGDDFDIPVDQPDGLLDADVIITVTRAEQ